MTMDHRVASGWDWFDVEIMDAWGRLNDHLCPQCGRPLAIHDHDKPSDYKAAFFTCTATQRLDELQKQWGQSPQGKKDKAAQDKGLHPERARRWFTYTAAEGLPSST